MVPLAKKVPDPGSSPAGGQWCPHPHLKSVPPHFTFSPLVATYIQYSILKMCPPLLVLAPPSGFWPPCCYILATGLSRPLG